MPRREIPFETIGAGRRRFVVRHGNYVIKFPMNEHGVGDNYLERAIWLRYGTTRGYIKYARCRLLGSILVMQYAQFVVEGKTTKTGYVYYSKDEPNWVDSVDCGQVGYNRFGQLVAYDYGR